MATANSDLQSGFAANKDDDFNVKRFGGKKKFTKYTCPGLIADL